MGSRRLRRVRAGPMAGTILNVQYVRRAPACQAGRLGINGQAAGIADVFPGV